jgi:hypothetical protein
MLSCSADAKRFCRNEPLSFIGWEMKSQAFSANAALKFAEESRDLFFVFTGSGLGTLAL